MINTKKKEANLNVISLQCTSNNTIGSLINSEGKLITTLSSGYLKYKGSRKGTQIASQQVIYYLGERALELGYDCILVKITKLIVNCLLEIYFVVIQIQF